MSKVDDELTRRFHRAERPVETGDLFEGVARRRRRRRTLQRLQAGALAVVVLVATAGGFLALSSAFRGGRENVGENIVLPANGEIVFSRKGDDGRFHLYAAQPDGSGERQLTDDASNDTDPSVSPDGQTVAFIRERGGNVLIRTIPLEGGRIASIATASRPRDLAWSPDGERVIYATTGIDSSWVEVVRVDGMGTEPVMVSPDSYLGSVADPTWSPDGDRIAFATTGGSVDAGNTGSWDLVTVEARDAGGLTALVASERDDEAPAWSPDGSRIAFIRPGNDGDQVWTAAGDGSNEKLLATAIEASLERDLAWAPDGSSLLVSDGDWIYQVDATPGGDVRDNFVQLMRGFSPSWQPIAAGAELTPSPSPGRSVSPSPEPEGVDVGIGFNLCHSKRLGGVDFLGRGTNGYAWVGVPAKDDATCPSNARPGAYVVAADADGDGRAETWSELAWECYVDCFPYDATDLDGDGTEELIVASSFSIMDYYVMRYLGPPDEPSPVIVPVLVAAPGHEPAGLQAGKPLRIDAGGDEGYGSQIECEGYPEAPVLVWSWSFLAVESEDPREVHITRIELRDGGEAHVVGTNDYTVPFDQASGIGRSEAPACDVDWHPNA